MQTAKNRIAVALIGKVYCRVDAEYSPIEIGDLLTTSQIPDIPRDGTVLKEIHGADAFLMQFGTKKHVVGPRRFFDLGLFWPDVGILWDGALDGFPDAGLA